MWGYVIQAVNSGDVKVGISRDVSRRLEQHRYGCAEGLVIRLRFPFDSREAALEWEKRTLLEFVELRVGGSEWLKASPRLTAAIETGVVGGQASLDLIQFNRQLYKAVYPQTKGRPFVFRDRRGQHGWCCVIFHPSASLAWLHWDFATWSSAIEAIPDLQYGACG